MSKNGGRGCRARAEARWLARPKPMSCPWCGDSTKPAKRPCAACRGTDRYINQEHGR